MAATPPVCDFGWKAPAFTLPGTDGRTYSLDQIAGDRGTLIMFICNHCPYVLSVLDRIIADTRDLQTMGIGVAAVSSNDPVEFPADSYENMAKLAADRAFPFPYLFDETQDVARAWGAACTPDFFGLNAARELQYRGRLDAFPRKPRPADAPRELIDAMTQIAETGKGPVDQTPSMGCSIKWRAA